MEEQVSVRMYPALDSKGDYEFRELDAGNALRLPVKSLRGGPLVVATDFCSVKIPNRTANDIEEGFSIDITKPYVTLEVYRDDNSDEFVCRRSRFVYTYPTINAPKKLEQVYQQLIDEGFSVDYHKKKQRILKHNDDEIIVGEYGDGQWHTLSVRIQKDGNVCFASSALSWWVELDRAGKAIAETLKGDIYND